jgi:hypothetical protein
MVTFKIVNTSLIATVSAFVDTQSGKKYEQNKNKVETSNDDDN